MDTTKVAIGFALGFGVNFAEDKLPELVPGQYRILFQSGTPSAGGFAVGVNDAVQAAAWVGVAALYDPEIGLAALAGLVVHQVLWYAFKIQSI